MRRTLYLALVRPQLGYATQVCAPQTIELTRHLERTQRRATKYKLFILHYAQLSLLPDPPDPLAARILSLLFQNVEQ